MNAWDRPTVAQTASLLHPVNATLTHDSAHPKRAHIARDDSDPVAAILTSVAKLSEPQLARLGTLLPASAHAPLLSSFVRVAPSTEHLLSTVTGALPVAARGLLTAVWQHDPVTVQAAADSSLRRTHPFIAAALGDEHAEMLARDAAAKAEQRRMEAAAEAVKLARETAAKVMAIFDRGSWYRTDQSRRAELMKALAVEKVPEAAQALNEAVAAGGDGELRLKPISQCFGGHCDCDDHRARGGDICNVTCFSPGYPECINCRHDVEHVVWVGDVCAGCTGGREEVPCGYRRTHELLPWEEPAASSPPSPRTSGKRKADECASPAA